MLTLLLDDTGRGIASGSNDIPGFVPGANEVEATPAQYAAPTAWMLRDGKLRPAPVLPAVPEPVPAISRAQAKIQLRREGLREQVEELIAAAGEDARDWYAEAGVWSRDNPYVAQIGAALGLTSERMDTMFRAAKLIEA